MEYGTSPNYGQVIDELQRQTRTESLKKVRVFEKEKQRNDQDPTSLLSYLIILSLKFLHVRIAMIRDPPSGSFL